MSARKAYISSLGTTGPLIAAALAMLVVVGALVAFDRWPSQAVAEAESVPVAGDGARAGHPAVAPPELERSGRAARLEAAALRRARTDLHAVASRAGRFERSVHPAAPAPAVSQPVISDLPAPTSEAPAAPAPAQPAPAAPAPAASSTP